ncbi:hypothetical protein ACFX2F_018323 [Malus domestica]
MQQVVFGLWHVWRCRNEWVFNGADPDGSLLGALGWGEYAEVNEDERAELLVPTLRRNEEHSDGDKWC